MRTSFLATAMSSTSIFVCTDNLLALIYYKKYNDHMTMLALIHYQKV